jgi:hypothetical protein
MSSPGDHVQRPQPGVKIVACMVDKEILDLLLVGVQAGVQGFLTLHLLTKMIEHNGRIIAESLPGTINFL